MFTALFCFRRSKELATDCCRLNSDWSGFGFCFSSERQVIDFNAWKKNKSSLFFVFFSDFVFTFLFRKKLGLQMNSDSFVWCYWEILWVNLLSKTKILMIVKLKDNTRMKKNFIFLTLSIIWLTRLQSSLCFVSLSVLFLTFTLLRWTQSNSLFFCLYWPSYCTVPVLAFILHCACERSLQTFRKKLSEPQKILLIEFSLRDDQNVKILYISVLLWH